MSSIIDYTDRTTCVLFGDGAGAIVLSAADPSPQSAGIIDFACEIDGSGGPALCMPAGGSRLPASHDTVDKRLHYVHQDGQTVFKFAVRKTEEICRRLLERNGLQPGDVDSAGLAPGQPPHHPARAEKLGIEPSRVVLNIEKYGNTTAADHPPRAGRCARRRPAQGWPPGDADVGRRRVHGRRRPAPLGRASAVPSPTVGQCLRLGRLGRSARLTSPGARSSRGWFATNP